MTIIILIILMISIMIIIIIIVTPCWRRGSGGRSGGTGCCACGSFVDCCVWCVVLVVACYLIMFAIGLLFVDTYVLCVFIAAPVVHQRVLVAVPRVQQAVLGSHQEGL